ncbi:hypothetical protein [Nitratireductor soli]|uniref:hypothetical protein n=1 Tax=Nitratireductor soli TaxID=1670619 RepID=UPI00065E05E3|nr:hypothetical protein [Nitratireductor soli]
MDGNGDGLVAYFGYGSLVNRATHRTEIIGAVPARLMGWRRQWVRRDDETERALLSVRCDADAFIDGLLIVDRVENLPSVDLREAHYARVALDPGAVKAAEALPVNCPIHVYQAKRSVEPIRLQIIQSYLDAVLQGFLREFGEEGAARFIAETDGFDAAILADRAAPQYPRAVALEPSEQAFLDALLAQCGLRIVPAAG